jgi:LysM repeat protein
MMDFLELLKFAPLIIGFAFIAFLLFRKDAFSSFNLGKLITYFIGVLITFFVVGWFVDSFVFSWANDRLENADNSVQFQEFKDRSERIIDDSFTNNTDNTVIQVQPTQPSASVTDNPANNPESSGQPARPESGPTQHVVIAGDTLFGIAQQYNTTVNDIMIINGLTSHTIIPGQVLNLPAPAQ